MFNQIDWAKPQTWHQNFSSKELTVLEGLSLHLFLFRSHCLVRTDQFSVPWTPVLSTFQTFAVLATGVYLRRNDAFISGCLYLLAGAIGAPVFAEGGDALFDSGNPTASGGYLRHSNCASISC